MNIFAFTRKTYQLEYTNFFIRLLYMKYLLLSDCLWYMGHILTGVSALIHDDFYLKASLVIIGQSITIISRPLGRLPEKPLEIKDDTFV